LFAKKQKKNDDKETENIPIKKRKDDDMNNDKINEE